MQIKCAVGLVFLMTVFAFANTAPLAASDEWQPIAMDNLLVESGTALDFSDAIPFVKPCGVKGRIIVNNEGKFAFEDEPSTAVRFNGFVCTLHRLFLYPVYWSRLTEAEWKAAIEAYVDGIVRQGFNMVRIHGLDLPLIYGGNYSIYPIYVFAEDVPFRTDMVDMFHYFMFCMKQRGVYVTIDLMASGAGYTSGWPFTDNPDVANADFRQMMYSDSVRRQNWKAGVTKLLTMVNPYTGTTLADDPILTFVVFNNEQTFTWGEKYCTNLDSRWQSWVKAKYSAAELCAAWPSLGLVEATAYDNIPSLNLTMASSYTAVGNDMTTFVSMVENELNDFYAETVSNLGYTGLTNTFNNSHTFFRIPRMAELDVVAFNAYIAHPSGSSVNQNSSLMPDIAGWTALWWFLDNPFVLTEYNHAFWNPFRHEQGIYLGSLAALQGWSGINMHSESVYPIHNAIATFHNQDDPIALASAAFTAFAYGRGDVQPASTSVAFLATDNDLWGRGMTTTANSIYGLRNLSLICRTGSRYDGASGTTASPAMEISHLDGTVRSLLGVPQTGGSSQTIDSLVSIMRSNGILSTSNLTNPSRNIYQSETGEITAYGDTGVMKVITPRLEGLTLKTDTQVDGDKLVVKSCSVPASIAAISLNADETLEQSSRILLLIATDALNTGMTFTNSSRTTVVDMGTLPVLLRTGQFVFELENTAINRPVVYSLNLDGTRADKLPVGISAGKIFITIDTENLSSGPTPFFEITQKDSDGTLSGWTLVDDFSGNLTTNWSVYSNLSTVDTLTNPLSIGPIGSVARLDMTQTVTGKYADIVLNEPLLYDGVNTTEIAFDLGYLFDTSCSYAGNWGQKFALLNAGGTEVMFAGHLGTLNAYPQFTNMFRVVMDSYDMRSTPPVGQASDTWYHYVVSLSSAETTVSVYSWISSYPEDYASEAPFWMTSVEALNSGSYSIQFYNSNTHASGDGDVNSRDTMYVDNVYTRVEVIPGDANGDGMVDVGDLGILAANYGSASGATWSMGDFNGDGAVDVGDLGILAANYGTGTSGVNWDADYAKVFGEATDDEDILIDETGSWFCSGFGLPLIAGLVFMGLLFAKLDK